MTACEEGHAETSPARASTPSRYPIKHADRVSRRASDPSVTLLLLLLPELRPSGADETSQPLAFAALTYGGEENRYRRTCHEASALFATSRSPLASCLYRFMLRSTAIKKKKKKKDSSSLVARSFCLWLVLIGLQ